MHNQPVNTTSQRWKIFFHTGMNYFPVSIILLLGLACYINSLTVPLQYDDYLIVRYSTDITADLLSWRGFVHTSRWFADLTFALNRYLHGEQVLGYHLINLALHLSTACGVYLFVRQAIVALRRTYRISGEDEFQTFLLRFVPFTTAALFVCHPVQTQAVTYISQRYTALAAFLYLCSLVAYLRARLAFTDESNKLHWWSWGVASFLSAVLAMKSKQTAFTLPLMMMALESTLFQGSLWRKRVFPVLGTTLLLVAAVLMIATNNDGNLLDRIESVTMETREISRIDYLLTQFRVVATYLRLLILPVNQNLDYDYPVYNSLIVPAVSAALLLHICLAGLAVILFIRSQRQLASGNRSWGLPLRLASLGIVWFYLALSVESSVIPIRDVIYEHRIYLPSIGFFMAAAACIACIASYGQRYRTTVWVAVVLLCLAFTAATIARNRIWSDEMVLWQDVLKKSPRKARPMYTVGWLYYRRFMPEKALPYLVRALELDSETQKHWNTLNATISLIGRYEGRCFIGDEYHTVDPRYRNSWMANSYNNLGLSYEHLGKPSLAWENYQKAVTFDPNLDLAWYNLALLAALRKDTATVEASLKRLRALNPILERTAETTIREQSYSIQFVPQ
jgi:tetratricopeptide (TPR) repeat protein